MNILYCSNTPLAGVCELMARCINKYYGPIHEGRVLNGGPGKHRWYLRDGKNRPLTSSVKLKDEVDRALDWADVVHCMANVSAKSFNRLDLLKKKVWVFQWHGAQIWPFTNVWDPEHYPHVRWIHIGQGWIERQMDFFALFFEKYGAKVVPNIISIEDPIHLPKPWDERTRRVAYSPSTKREGVNNKGFKVTQDAMHGTAHRTLSGMPFEETMREKRNAILGIDEVVTPMYHRSGLEFLSQGVPCVCSYSRDTEQMVFDVLGSNEMPFIQCGTVSFLRRVLATYFKSDENLKKELSFNARAWIEKYYHPRDLLKRYLDVYES